MSLGGKLPIFINEINMNLLSLQNIFTGIATWKYMVFRRKNFTNKLQMGKYSNSHLGRISC